jgi:hypothetical protein
MDQCLLRTHCIEDSMSGVRFWLQCRTIHRPWLCVIVDGERLVRCGAVLVAACASVGVMSLLIVLHVVLPVGEIV